MKYLNRALASLIFLFVLCVGSWFFAPWHTIATYAIDKARMSAVRQGVYISYDTLDTQGRFRPEFELKNVQIEHAVAKADIANVRLKILPLESLRTLGLAARLQFNNSAVTTITRNSFEASGGEVLFMANKKSLQLLSVQIAGNLSATGNLTYDRTARKVAYSDLVFTVPDRLNAVLSSPILGRFFESPKPGEWRIRYNAAQNR